MALSHTSRGDGTGAHSHCRSGRKRDADPKAHGTPYRYKLGCRCDPCKEGNAARMRAYYKEKREARGLPYEYLDCVVCGDPLERMTVSEEPMHARCDPGGPWISASRRTALYERDGYRCQICGCDVLLGEPNSPRAATLDHIKPRSLRGTDEDDNLRTACRYCNTLRGNNIVITNEELAARSRLLPS